MQKMNRFNHLVFLSILNFVAVTGLSQPEILRTMDSLNYVSKLDALELMYGKNKVIPNSHKLCFLIALSYYPELSQSKIIIKQAHIKTTLNARPSFFSTIFRDKSNRRHVIRINNSGKPNRVLLDQADFNSKIGLMGHELAHILDYHQTNTPGIFLKGASYLTTKGKKKIENDTDRMVIHKGLGWQLYDWSIFLFNQSCASEKYKSYKRKVYLSPDQIVEEMNLDGNAVNMLHVTQNQ